MPAWRFLPRGIAASLVAALSATAACTTLRPARVPLPYDSRVEVTLAPSRDVLVVSLAADSTIARNVRAVHGRIIRMTADTLLLRSAKLQRASGRSLSLSKGDQVVILRQGTAVKERRVSGLRTFGAAVGLTAGAAVVLLTVVVFTWDCGAC